MIFGAFFFAEKRLTQLLSHIETNAQRYLWLYCCAVVKGTQIVSPSFICILKGEIDGSDSMGLVFEFGALMCRHTKMEKITIQKFLLLEKNF